jgi:CHAT domain-containing protein/Tfp pilus assembly protein PilF
MACAPHQSRRPSAYAAPRTAYKIGCVTLLLLLAGVYTPACCDTSTSQAAGPAAHSPSPGAGQNAGTPPQMETVSLQPGVMLTRELAGGGHHDFKVYLSLGQYLRILVEQYGINLTLTLFDPRNTQVIEMNSPSGAYGPEYVSAIATVAGDYRLEVRAADKRANAGRYEILVEELRTSLPTDSKRLDAEQAFVRGQQLMAGDSKKSRQEAIAQFRQARAYWTELGDRHWQALTSYSECAAQRIDNPEGSIQCFDNSLAFPLDEHDWRLKATILNDRGSALSARSRFAEAEASFMQALELFRQHQDRRGQASALNNIGVAYARAGRMREAIKFYEEAAPLRRAENDIAGEANVNNNIGGYYDFLGEPRQALAHYSKALEVWRELDARGELDKANRDKIGKGFNNVAYDYDYLGEWQQAIEAYKEALNIFERLESSQNQADTLDNLGELYMALGDQLRAMDCFTKAQRLLEENKGTPESLANVLAHIGQLYQDQGRLREASSNFEAALNLRRTPDGRASALTNIGSVQALAGQTQSALSSYNQALELRRRSGAQRGLATTLHKRGEAYAAGGEYAEALADFTEALQFWRAIADRRGEAASLLERARVERARNNFAKALEDSQEALGIVESLRSKVASQRLRTAYFSTKQNYYELYIDLKMRLYERDKSKGEMVAAAFQASERARARSLIDTLGEAGVNIREGVSLDLLRREHAIQQDIDAKARAKSEYKYTKEQAAALDKELDALIAEYDDVLTKIRVSSPNAAHLIQPQVQGMAEIQRRLLDDDTLLLEFHLGQENSYLWAVSNTSLDGYTLPKREVVEKAARGLYNLMTTPQPAADGSVTERRRRIEEARTLYTSQAAALSQMLLGKAAGLLGKKRLLVVADGVLQYLPFGALPAPVIGDDALGEAAAHDVRPYLIEEHEIVSLPSASVAAVLRDIHPQGRHAPLTVAVLADPVFDRYDSRVQQPEKGVARSKEIRPNGSDGEQRPSGIAGIRSGTGLQSLPLTREEATAIVGVAGTRGTLVAEDFDASRATLVGLKPGQYRIIHFATHGLVDDERPEMSGVVLSMVNRKGEPQDGILRLQDIYNLRLSADMVVLSACSTGLGNTVRGEGLVGLTRGFMYAGSPRVVASLWRVDDFATVRLMQRFYHSMLKEGRTPPAALQQAQIEMLREKRWSLPYFWAAFLIQGDWRAIN